MVIFKSEQKKAEGNLKVYNNWGYGLYPADWKFQMPGN